MKIRQTLFVGTAMGPAAVLAANIILVDAGGNAIGECLLNGASVAQTTGTNTVAGVPVTANGVGDLLVVVDSTCNLGSATNLPPSFDQASPYNAGTVNANSSKLINLSASDPEGDVLTWSIASQPASGLGTASVSGTGFSKTVTYNAGSSTGTASFTVRIDDGKGNTADLTVNVTITNTQLPAACDNVNPGIPVDTTGWGQAGQREYTPLEPGASHADVGVDRGKYKYKQAFAINDGDSGQILIEDTAYFDIAVKMVSISECPGDFGGVNGTALPAACVRTSNSTGIMTMYYRTPSATAQTFGCTLDPNKTYYLNVVHATNPDDLAGSNTCPAATCGFNIDTVEN